MGRNGPRLVPFLQSGLRNKKYRNLIWENSINQTFSLVLPHKTKKLAAEDEHIFKDWYAKNSKNYIIGSKHYTDAKQAITASLRKSDYVEKVHISDNKITYRILSEAECKEKKRIKKEFNKKNQTKHENSDNDDALSPVESGYSSSSDSPRSDHGLMLLNDNIFRSSDNESSKAIYPMETNGSFGMNDLQQSKCSDEFLGCLKSEPVDHNIPTEISLAIPDTPLLFDWDFTKFQSFDNNFGPADYFAEDIKHPSDNLDLMDCSLVDSKINNLDLTVDFPSENELENEDDLLKLDEDLACENLLNSMLLNEVSTLNFNPSEESEKNANNHISETQNMYDLSTDTLFEELNKLIEDISVPDPDSSSTFKNNQAQIFSSTDSGLNAYKTEAKERFYVCKICIHLGKTPILLCEPQFETSTAESSGDINIAASETVLKEINGFRVKEFKPINDHLMAILEPNDD